MDNTKQRNFNEITIKNPMVLFLSFFGVGFIPYAPGTMGTIAAMPFLLLLNYFQIPSFFLIIPFIVIFIGSVFMTSVIQEQNDLKDPSWIVIDEVLGIMTVWILCMPQTLLMASLAFILFRLFDIIKIWPTSFFDKKMKHPAGVILDDIFAGTQSVIVLCLIKYFL